MSTATKSRPKARKAKSEHQSAVERVSGEIIRLIDEQGTVPWQKGWLTDGIWPTNPVTGTVYKGINPMILGLYASARGYTSPYWVTFKQMVAKGASFRAPATGQGVQVVFWSRIVKPDPDDADKTKAFGFWKVYTVFNLDLIEGIEVESVHRVPITLDDALVTLQKGYAGGPSIRNLPSAQAYYTPATHQITLPMVEQFTSSIGYGETLAHELCHSTGHESLLNRNLKGWNCREDYAKEELVAEIGAVMVLQMLGIDVDLPRAADYINGWRKAISEDPALIVSAASKAYYAASMVLGADQNDTKEVAA